MLQKSARLLMVMASLLLPAAAAAKAPVWKVSSGEKMLYLGGTIHVLSDADYPLPLAFDQAYKNASTVVFETDLSTLQNPAFMQRMLPHLMYQRGEHIEQFLRADTEQQLQDYLHSRGVPLQSLRKYKPGMLSITMTMLELRRLGLAGVGVDQYFSSRATRDNKSIGELETASSQIHKIAAMGTGQEDTFIRKTLQELEALPELLHNMKAAWRGGHAETLNDITLSSLVEDFPGIYQSLLVDRNLAWLPKFIDMLESQDTELVLVGAAHLVGADGLLNQLEGLGYTVEQM